MPKPAGSGLTLRGAELRGWRRKACAGGRKPKTSSVRIPRLFSVARVLVTLSVVSSLLVDLDGAEIARSGAGPFAVATTNLEVRPQTDAKVMFDFLNGRKTPTGMHYLTDILVHPDAVPTVQLDVPADPKRFGPFAGTRLPIVLLVAYPTSRDNPRPDYAFPYTETGDRTLTHMQGPGDRPRFPDPAAKYPLIVVSGGYNTHGLWHLQRLKHLAAHGYIVLDLFHGDGRSEVFAVNLALRALGVRAALDHLLRDPCFGPAIDAARIGAIGESAGAHTVLTALGGVDPSGRVPPLADPRLKAAVGVVPFMGASFGFWPFKIDAWHFGADYAGLRGVRRPFLALYGGEDSNVPPAGVEAGVRALGGPAWAVCLDNEAHLLTDVAQRDVLTWELLFFDAWVRGDSISQRYLDRAVSVEGGAGDRVTLRTGKEAVVR